MTTALATADLRTIRVYGTLARLIGRRELRAVVSSVPEAMRFLMANFPQVEGHLKGRFFKVKVANWALTQNDLDAPIGQTEDIHIIPAICGAGGDGPLVGILAGAALIGVGLLVPFGGSVLVPLGLGLLLNGVAALLSPTPEVADKDNDPARSYNFSGIQQTSREGVPVPLVYGDIVTGSVVLSVNIERDDEELSAEFDAGEGGFRSQVVGGLYNSQYPGICWYYYIEVYLEQDPDCAPNQPPKIFTNISQVFAHRPFSTATLPYNPQYLDPDNCFNLVARGGSARFTVLDAGGCTAPFFGSVQDNTEYSVSAAFDNTGGLQPIGMRIWHEKHSGPSYSNVPRTLVFEHSRFGDPLPDALRP
jgi:predicted phage tail protein